MGMINGITLDQFYDRFASEQMCRDYLEKIRWGDGTACPKCNVVGESYKYTNRRLYKCRACNKQFTVRVSTIFEGSKLPLQNWFLAIYLATALKKGISSMQLSGYLGITQKTAWLMLRRLRYAVEYSNRKAPLSEDFRTDNELDGEIAI